MSLSWLSAVIYGIAPTELFMVIDGFIFIIFSYNLENAKWRLFSVGVNGRRKVTLIAQPKIFVVFENFTIRLMI